MNLSFNQIKNITSFIRKELGRDSFEPMLENKLSECNKVFESYFEVQSFNFVKLNKDEETVSAGFAVYCNNSAGLIEYVKNERKVCNVFLKFGIDSDGESLKIFLSIQSFSSEGSDENSVFSNDSKSKKKK